MSENVNHPKHYASGRIEVIEFIEDQGFGPGFCKGNAIKYAARAGKKDPEKEIEDLEKAVWYLNREIETLKAAKDNRTATRPNDMNPRSTSVTAALSSKAPAPEVAFVTYAQAIENISTGAIVLVEVSSDMNGKTIARNARNKDFK